MEELETVVKNCIAQKGSEKSLNKEGTKLVITACRALVEDLLTNAAHQARIEGKDEVDASDVKTTWAYSLLRF